MGQTGKLVVRLKCGFMHTMTYHYCKHACYFKETRDDCWFLFAIFSSWKCISFAMGNKVVELLMFTLSLSINPFFSEACKTIHFSLQECKTKNRFCSADLVFFVASDPHFHHIYNQTARNIFPPFSLTGTTPCFTQHFAL